MYAATTTEHVAQNCSSSRYTVNYSFVNTLTPLHTMHRGGWSDHVSYTLCPLKVTLTITSRQFGECVGYQVKKRAYRFITHDQPSPTPGFQLGGKKTRWVW